MAVFAMKIYVELILDVKIIYSLAKLTYKVKDSVCINNRNLKNINNYTPLFLNNINI